MNNHEKGKNVPIILMWSDHKAIRFVQTLNGEEKMLNLLGLFKELRDQFKP